MSKTFKTGSGCYTCFSCGKQTRETGQGESDIEACAFCYHEGGIENSHEDACHQPGDEKCCPLCNTDRQSQVKALCESYLCQPPKASITLLDQLQNDLSPIQKQAKFELNKLREKLADNFGRFADIYDSRDYGKIFGAIDSVLDRIS